MLSSCLNLEPLAYSFREERLENKYRTYSTSNPNLEDKIQFKGGRSVTSSNFGSSKKFPQNKSGRFIWICSHVFTSFYFSWQVHLGFSSDLFLPCVLHSISSGFMDPKTKKILKSTFLFPVFQKSLKLDLQRKYILYASENSTKPHGHSLCHGEPKCAKIFHMFFGKYCLFLLV